MKKLLFVLSMLFIATSTFASDIKLISGNPQVLKEAAKATFFLDLKGTRWEDDDDFKEWCGKDYEVRIDKAKTGFITGFNEISKALKISEEGDTKYSIIVKVDNFVQRCPGIPCYIKIYGTIIIVDNATSQSVCQFQIKGLSGRSDYSPDDRFRRSFYKLARTLINQFS